MAQEKSKAFMRKYRTDILVVASLIVLSLVVLLVMNLTRQEGAYAEVTVGENVVGRYPLSQNGTYTLNGGTNVLTIEDGYAYMSYSDCPTISASTPAASNTWDSPSPVAPTA